MIASKHHPLSGTLHHAAAAAAAAAAAVAVAVASSLALHLANSSPSFHHLKCLAVANACFSPCPSSFADR